MLRTRRMYKQFSTSKGSLSILAKIANLGGRTLLPGTDVL